KSLPRKASDPDRRQGFCLKREPFVLSRRKIKSNPRGFGPKRGISNPKPLVLKRIESLKSDPRKLWFEANCWDSLEKDRNPKAMDLDCSWEVRNPKASDFNRTRWNKNEPLIS